MRERTNITMNALDDGDSIDLCSINPNNALKRSIMATMKGRTRSASLGRDKKSDLRARYWAFLFENLQHAVDELYQTCETDENISECKEVILVLENYAREFQNLTEWFRVKWEYENTPPPQRPNSLAWEIRKSSPGKVFRGKQKLRPNSTGVACRELLYELNKPPDESCETKVPETECLNQSIQSLLKIPENKSHNEAKTAPINVETNDRVCVDNSSQTSDDLLSVAVKKPPWNVGRRTFTSTNSSACVKKIPRNFTTATSLAETKTSIASCKRLTCVSPKKPPPGRNIAAPEFIPGTKITSVKLATTKDQQITPNDSNRIKVLRSQSDSVFETATKKTKNADANGQTKPFASTPCLDVLSEEGHQTPLVVSKLDKDEKSNASPSVAQVTPTTTSVVENQQPSVTAIATKPANESLRRILRVNCKLPSTGGGKITHSGEAVEKQAVVKSPSCRYQFSKGRRIIPRDSVPAKTNESQGTKSQNLSQVEKNVKLPAEKDDKWPKVKTNNYVAVTKSSSSQNHCNRREGYQRNKFAAMTRSKTSIDMKPKSTTLRSAGKVATVATPKENESPTKYRRSSKDTDGWETVMSRSRRSIPTSLNPKGKLFDVNNRFHEPSSSTSLPTLLMLESESDNVKDRPQGHADSKTKVIEVKKNRNRNNSQSYPSRETTQTNETETEPPATNSSDVPSVAQGNRNYNTLKERPIISNTAMFTTIQTKKKKPNDKAKVTRETKNTPKRKCSAESEEQNKTREDLLDEESLRKSKELYEKEIILQKEINDLQNDADLETDAEVDVDSDSTEVDQEIVDLCESNKNKNAFERRAALEAKYNHILTNMTWAEQVETLDKLEELLARDPSGKNLKFAKNFTSLKQFEDLVTRAPGRASEVHQKLSSPSRKRISPDSTILQHKARQAKAKQNREQLFRDKCAKIRELFNKVAEVKVMQAQLVNERRKLYEQKLKRAEENRNLHLKKKQEKAHDEAKKQKEIAFINELEAQNKRHDFYALLQEQEDRFQSILEDRQRRQEEKAAKEAAAEERRKAIEAERQEKIEELQEKMRKREERIDRELQEKERERIKMAKEKARDREDRLLALHAAQIANAEELQKKIQQKQENSARRHEENIELIRQKAIEIGTPRLTPYQINKLCSVCNVVIDSEVFLLSHLKGKSHQEAIKKYREQFEANIKFSECSIITDAPADILHEKKNREKERQKTLRKRCKKIRQRLSNRNEETLENVLAAIKDKHKKSDSSNKGRILKSIKEVDKVINTQGSGVWPNNAVTMLERNLFEIIRILERGNQYDQYMFRAFDGFVMISKIYNLALDLPKNMSPYLPMKCLVVTSNLFATACRNNVENCLHVLFSNSMVQILDFLLNRLNLIMPNSDDRNGMVVYKADTVADVLMNLCSNVLSVITSFVVEHNEDENTNVREVSARLQDVVSYIVCTGIVDKLAVYCSSVHDNKSADSYFLLHCMELLTRLVETRRGRITDKEDCTQLMATLKATELVGAVSMLYAMLLHRDSISNDSSSIVVELPSDVVNVIIATLRLFSKVGELNLKFFQNILGAEGISLQVRHIISYLLRYCTQNEGYKDLLHQVIEFIGFFAIHHTDNQMILQSGSTPTVLQQLSSLPFCYFSNPTLVRILFPTLLACCVGNPQNRSILDQEVSFQLLEDFRNAEDSKDIPLIRLLQGN